MLKERTLCIVKPLALKEGHTGDIITMIERAGFVIVAIKKLHLKEGEARSFYMIHREKSFFNDLIKFMTSGPIIVMALEKVNAVSDLRKLMGSTNPSKAEEGTIRHKYATSTEKNAVHGSDTIEHAHQEVKFFFSELEIIEI